MSIARPRLLILPAMFALAAPSPAPDPATEPLTIAQARGELAGATARSATLRRAADKAAGTLARVQLAQRAAAGELEAAEARIVLAGLELEQAERAAANARARLRAAQKPASALLAGLATMARRPPLLALAHEGGVDEIVRTRILLDSTLPVVRRRAAALSADLDRLEQLSSAARSRRAALRSSIAALADRRRAYAAIEQRALELTAAAGGAALAAGDEALAAGESLERLRSAESGSAATRAAALEIARGAAIPARPVVGDGGSFAVPFAYRLPADQAVTQGLGAIDANGVRSRGLTLATPRGAALMAPASGTVRFAGPFRGLAGVLIIDHGDGWMSLMVNAASPLKVGQRVTIGDSVGRALGPLTLELSRNGKRYSPALIAGSSPPLSKRREGG